MVYEDDMDAKSLQAQTEEEANMMETVAEVHRADTGSTLKSDYSQSQKLGGFKP